MKKYIESIRERIKLFFKVNDDYKITKIMILVVLVVITIAYNRVFTGHIANPDGLVEGFYYYVNADWASAGCGRWFIRYYNLLHCNIVSPVLVLFEYMLFSFLTSIVVVKVLEIKNRISIALTTVVLCLTPTVIAHLSYTCTAAPYALGEFLSSLFVYFIFKEEKVSSLFAIFCLTLSLGCYQSYVGFAATLTLMTFIVKLIKKEDINKLFRFLLKAIICAIVAGILYYIIYVLDLKIYGLVPVERLADYSFKDIITMFPKKFIETYTVYFNNFNDGILKHKFLYSIFAVFVVIVVLYEIFKLIKEKEIKRTIIFIVSILLLPCATNVIGIIIPNNPITVLMCQQNWLIFPFVFAILEIINSSLLLQKTVYLFAIFVFLTYSISANATFACYELSNKYNNSQLQMALNRVYDLESYKKDETKIVMIGFPDETTLRKNNVIYRYGVNLNDNLMFWENLYGLSTCRERYFMNMFGIDPKYIDIEDYSYVITSKKYKDMPCWPKEGSVDMIGDYAVIKFTNEIYYN